MIDKKTVKNSFVDVLFISSLSEKYCELARSAKMYTPSNVRKFSCDEEKKFWEKIV
jgi:hypothetical protein